MFTAALEMQRVLDNWTGSFIHANSDARRLRRVPARQPRNCLSGHRIPGPIHGKLGDIEVNGSSAGARAG